MAAPPATSVRDVVDYDLLFDCVHCGLCLEACPTYAVTRAEMDSPRGRIYLMKALAEGRLQLEDDAARHLDLCLGCRGCETACPSGVHYGQLIERARVFVEENYSRSVPQRTRRILINAIFPYPARLRAVLAPLKIAERIGLRPLLGSLLPGGVREWLELLPPLHQSGEARAGGLPAGAPGAPAVVVHHGCVAQVLANAENLATESVLAAAGYRVIRLAETGCCGALDLHSGNRGRALDFVRRNVRALARSGADAIVSAASGCSAAVAEYGSLLRDDRELADAARQVAAKVKDLSGLLLERGLPTLRKIDCTVTFHDACHLVHGLGVREGPRRVLAAMPGVNLIELGESDLCCGSAGSYNLTEPGMARALARRKVDNILATGADYLVLSNPGCEFQIAAELRRRRSEVKVVHLSQFIAQALTNG
jgi:glycolate oxidase iron-sulfur subunit